MEAENKNSVTDRGLRCKYIKDAMRDVRIFGFSDSYMFYDRDKESFTVNRLAYISDCYAYEVQHENYLNGYVVMTLLQDNGFSVQDDIKKDIVYEEQLRNIIAKDTFVDRMRQYCSYRMSQEESIFTIPIEQMERKYQELRPYYDELGGERIKALGYRRDRLEKAIRNNRAKTRMQADFRQMFKTGMRIPTPEIKRMIQEVYKSYNVDETPKATDLMKEYGIGVKRCKIPGSRVSGYEIL